ncbi:MAG: hypothetical protein A3K18_07440 [Lentisphaerae bacterium RIFOXYA12_64_32]|nr:MAG: hypothetical protein A3K18_07440 [Lentisphaerae bacterium RIFOXYA12_64_32]
MAFRYTGFADEAGKSLAEQISVVQKAGWNSIELRAISGKSVCDLTDAEWAEVWGTLQKEKITVAGFGGQIANWARPITNDFAADVAELKRVAPRMKQAGTRLLRVMSYPNAKEPWPVDPWKKEVFKRLRELAKMAEDLDVILGHENCSGYGGLGPSQYMELVDAVKSPALKLIFDTGNNSGHDNDIEATWRYYEACKQEIVHVHIKAYKRGADGKMQTCYPDEDPVQKRVLADLKKRGYSDWVSIEPHMAAAIHAGKDVSDADAARRIWLEYAQRLEKIVTSIR